MHWELKAVLIKRLLVHSLPSDQLRDQIIQVINPLTPAVAIYSYKASSCARLGLAAICNFWHPGTMAPRAERQCARVSKMTNDGLTRSGTGGCFIAVPMATVGVKGLKANLDADVISLRRGTWHWMDFLCWYAVRNYSLTRCCWCVRLSQRVVVVCKGPWCVGDIQCFRTETWVNCVTSALATTGLWRSLTGRRDPDSSVLLSTTHSIDLQPLFHNTYRVHCTLTPWLTKLLRHRHRPPPVSVEC